MTVASCVDLLNSASFEQLSWMILIAYALHYLEEGPRLVAWMNEHHKVKGLHYSQKKLDGENLLYFGMQTTFIVLLNTYPDSTILRMLVLGAAPVFLANLPFHLIPTLKTGIYSPGVVSAAALFPMQFALLLWKAGQQGILTLPLLLGGFVIQFALFFGSLLVVHKIIFAKRAQASSAG